MPCTSTSCSDGESCVDFTCVSDKPVEGMEILNYSFDDYEVTDIAHDRSGNRFDGYFSDSISGLVPGKYGLGIELQETMLVERGGLRIPYKSQLYSGNTITIEAFVKRTEGMSAAAIYSDYVPEVGVEYSLELTAEDTLEFVTSDGCLEVISFQSTATVQTGVWQHVAVTWDGQNVLLYINGEEAGSFVSTAVPCAFDNQYYVGARGDESQQFAGTIDEVKVSDYAKTAAEIVQSMEHDSLLDIGKCGDNLLENEVCLADSVCCSDSCEALVDTDCGSGICNESGACIVEGGRVVDGLVVLYEFDEVSGSIVYDTSGVKPALDLTISSMSAVTWTGESLQVIDTVTISSMVGAAKIVSPISVTSEFSAEVWVSPANTSQHGPARIVTMSPGTAVRNFTLGQEAESYVTRITSSETVEIGLPALDTPRGDVVSGLSTHLLVTRSAAGLRRFYVNGVLRSETPLGGSLGVWGDYPLALANEVTGERPWLGEFFLTAIYSRALTPEEVSRNFSAGPNSGP